MADRDTQVIQPPFQNAEKFIAWGQFNVVLVQLNKVLASMLAANDGQGLAWVNPYIPVGSPTDGDIPQWDAAASPPAYIPTPVDDIIGFAFFNVDTESSLPTGGDAPTIPSFGYTQDTGVYYVYNLVDVAWQKVGLILP